MSIWRVILCIVFPPLAVIDKGCGSIVIVQSQRSLRQVLESTAQVAQANGTPRHNLQSALLADHSFLQVFPGFDQAVASGNPAVEHLREQLAQRYQLNLVTHGQGKVVALVIRPGSVEVGSATDNDRSALSDQAYRLQDQRT